MLPARTAYHLVHNELLLDATSRLNLATFVGTWMEPEARVLITEHAQDRLIAHLHAVAPWHAKVEIERKAPGRRGAQCLMHAPNECVDPAEIERMALDVALFLASYRT